MSEARAYLITGATGGIGSALSRHLANAGCQLTLAARSKDPLQELAGALGADVCAADLTDPEQALACVKAAQERHGRLDGVAHCVGSLLLKSAHLTTHDEWSATLATNLTSAFSVLKAAVRVMGEGGSIVLVASAAARTGIGNHEAIAAAKAGVIGLARSAAASYAHRQIRVNCVAPGLVETPLTERLTTNESARQASLALHPLGRLGKPQDVASLIAFLLSPEASWLTGEVVGIDGGLAQLRARR